MGGPRNLDHSPPPSISTLLAPICRCAASQKWLMPQHAAVCRSFPSAARCGLCVICSHLAGCSFRRTIYRTVPPRARPPCIPDGLSRLATTGPIGMFKAHPWHPMLVHSVPCRNLVLVLTHPAVESAVLNSAQPHAQQLNRCRFGRRVERPFLIPLKHRQHSLKTKICGTARPHANCD